MRFRSAEIASSSSLRERLPSDAHLARCRTIERAEEMQQRALARAARADDRHHLAALAR